MFTVICSMGLRSQVFSTLILLPSVKMKTLNSLQQIPTNSAMPTAHLLHYYIKSRVGFCKKLNFVKKCLSCKGGFIFKNIINIDDPRMQKSIRHNAHVLAKGTRTDDAKYAIDC